MAGAGDMTIDISKARIFIRPGYTDLRKAVNGLAVLQKSFIRRAPGLMLLKRQAGQPKIRIETDLHPFNSFRREAGEFFNFA